MRIAILSDIHANREAFAAVLAEVQALAPDRIVLLGDIVGYGPDPEWCVDRAQALADAGAVCIRGNHDSAIGTAGEAMNDVARAAIDWTRPRLDAGQRGFLAGLPLTHEMEGALFVHASADHPADWIYVTGENKVRAAFHASPARLILCGHTHVPALWCADLSGRVTAQRMEQARPVPLIRSRRWLAVAGSVGQPRDGAPLAGWAWLDTGTGELTFRRTRYDVAATMRKLREAGLPEALAVRLGQGR